MSVADDGLVDLQRAVAAFDLAEEQLQREDSGDAERLKLAFKLYSAALSHADGSRAEADCPQDHQEDDVVRAGVLQQRARALSAIYACARRQPRSNTQRRVARGAELLALLLGASLVLVGSWLWYDASEVGNAALGKRWTASSGAEGAPPSGTLTNAADHFFFHTGGRELPVLELDLGRPTLITNAKIVNRDDCCAERAVPLVLEASTDHRAWRELARRRRSFGVWRSYFAPYTARWVRLRVLRLEAFHLKRIVIR